MDEDEATDCPLGHTPNAETEAVMRDGLAGKNLRSFDTAEAFFADLYGDEPPSDGLPGAARSRHSRGV